MPEREIVEYVYEYWDCPKCGRKAIRGDKNKCPDCGYPRDDSITFYRTPIEEVIFDEKQIREFTEGPDWVCSFCTTLNPQSAAACKGCGATKDNSTKNYFDILEKRRARDAGGASASSTEDSAPAAETGMSPASKKKIIGGVIGAITVIGAVLFWAFSSSEVMYKVTDVSWERTIPILRYAWNDRTDWHDSLVGDDIRELSRVQEIRRYEKRQIGTETEVYYDTERYQKGTKEECSTSYTSTGSGASKKVTKCRDVPVYESRQVRKTRLKPVYRDFPVYAAKVRYRSKAFDPFSSAVLKGNDNKPQWPKAELGQGVDGKSDKVGPSQAVYRVYLSKEKSSDKGKDKVVVAPTEDRFIRFFIKGNTIPMQINNLGNLSLEKGESEITQ